MKRSRRISKSENTPQHGRIELQLSCQVEHFAAIMNISFFDMTR